MIKVKVKILRTGAKVPVYQTDGATCFDLKAYGSYVIPPGETVLVNTGLAMEFNSDYGLEIVPRSGLAGIHGITVANSPGQIDSDYRGELKVLLYNSSKTEFVVKHEDRIAQAKFVPRLVADFTVVDKLSETERGQGGIGSTGI